MNVAKIEEDLGIEVFSTSSKGIGGAIRQSYDDFIVREIPLQTSSQEELETSRTSGKYTIFWLEKRGLDTLLAIKRIARSLRISQKRLSFAGMKDRNAVTVQRVSAYNVPPGKLEEISLKGIRIKFITRSDKAVQMGSHWGNSFSIAVRGIQLAQSELERRIQSVINEVHRIGGFPNYFGYQRFGLSRPITHEVGLKLLTADLKGAAMIFLSKPSPYESKEVREAREGLSASEDFGLALKRFPAHLSYERAMLNRLASNPNNFANAFRSLPMKLLRMFTSAAQSWLFNKFISRRFRENLAPTDGALGDLVAAIDSEGLATGEPTRVDESSITRLNNELRTGKAAVVYPVPGFDMKLPPGHMRDIVKEIMTHENLMPRSFWIGIMPELSSPGIFRPILLIPKDLKVTTSSSDTRDSASAIFEFSLVRGAYATVVLREFMKNDDPVAAGY